MRDQKKRNNVENEGFNRDCLAFVLREYNLPKRGRLQNAASCWPTQAWPAVSLHGARSLSKTVYCTSYVFFIGPPRENCWQWHGASLACIQSVHY